jgi:hypothetical protein
MFADACDTNDDGRFDIADAVYILSYVFDGGPPPPPPFPDCGIDPTPDDLWNNREYDCHPPPPVQNDEYVLAIPKMTVGSGARIEIPITLDNPDYVIGWSFGVCHDPAALSFDSVVAGKDALTANRHGVPDFQMYGTYDTGWTAGVFVNLLGVSILKAGQDQEIAVATYDVVGEIGTRTEITFCENLGAPPIAAPVVVHGGDGVLPARQAGTVDIVRGFRRGDSNADGAVDIADGIAVLQGLFAQGPVMTCLKSADANDDGQVDIGDGIYLLQYLFLYGPLPPAPLDRCGADPTADLLTCDAYPPCE